MGESESTFPLSRKIFVVNDGHFLQLKTSGTYSVFRSGSSIGSLFDRLIIPITFNRNNKLPFTAVYIPMRTTRDILVCCLQYIQGLWLGAKVGDEAGTGVSRAGEAGAGEDLSPAPSSPSSSSKPEVGIATEIWKPLPLVATFRNLS